MRKYFLFFPLANWICSMICMKDVWGSSFGMISHLKTILLCNHRLLVLIYVFMTRIYAEIKLLVDVSFLSFFWFFLFVCLFFRATPTAYGGSQARGQIGAVAPGIHHQSHSHARSLTHWARPGIQRHPPVY